jgi:hypothetical protein
MNQTKRTGTAVAIGLASLMALAVFIVAAPAGAVVFNMGGPEPGSAGVDMSSTSGLYASGRDGSVTLVAQIGAIAPDGDVFNDLGVPSISPEGDVVFGAETIGQDNRPRWSIYRAKPGAPGNQRIVPVLDGVSFTKDCRPNLKTDPYAVAGPAGMVVFLAPEASGKDAIFRYADGHLTCTTRIGERTAQGHELKLIYFGSADVAENGDVAFLGKVDDHGVEKPGVLTLDANSKLQEVARAGAQAPGGGKFEPSFGRPSILNSPLGDLIAFTNRSSKTDTVYLSNAGKLARSFGTGSRTTLGKLTYVSDGPPGLLADGTMLVTGAVHDRFAVFRARDGKLVPIKREGDLTQFGTHLKSFVDPSVTSSGLVYIGGHDDSGRERLFVFDSGDGAKVPIEARIDTSAAGRWMPPFFPGSLAVNSQGDLTALGVAPDADVPTLRTVTFDW